jgi:type IV pilus assembly protein PilY1
MSQKAKPKFRLSRGRTRLLVLLGLLTAGILYFVPFLATALPAPSLAISQQPLQLAIPVHPQVMIAIGNSESMDGNLSGAIMVGSGSLGAGLSALNGSSSPINYSVPAGFTPPVTPAVAGLAPYTSNQSGNLIDNGDSRLNVAKAGVSGILSTYMQNTDFALMDYNTGGPTLYSTWVYYMSGPGGFSFSNVSVPRVGTANFTVVNPCFGYLLALPSTVTTNCAAMVPTLYSSATLSTNQYLLIAASSDDANVNDVLYTSPGQPAVYVNYAFAGLSNSTLAGYNAGNVRSTYGSSLPNANKVTGPTNAGYVPQSPQVMYVQRGFAYGASQSATSGRVLVNMTTAGAAPTTASISASIANFTPFLLPETNKGSTSEIKASAGQASMAGLLSTAKTYLASVKTSGACAQPQYLVLLSDGLPTEDLAGKSWPPLGSAAASTYGVTATFNADGSVTPVANATNNDQALIDTITTLAALKAAGVNTYIIGMGAGVDPSLNPAAAATLKAMAVAGGTGSAYPATSPAALVSALNSVLLNLLSGSLSATQSAVNSSHPQPNSPEYQARLTSNDTPYQDWTGDLTSTPLDPITGQTIGSVTWSAQSLLDGTAAGTGWSTNRVIATWNPTLNSGAGGGAPFRSLNLSTTQTTQLGNTATLQYIRGDQSLEQRNGGSYRNRSHILGDIVDSTPLYVGAPTGTYFSASYFNYVSAKSARSPMVYVGANDGMLHAFNGATGQEQFAFVPNSVFSKLSMLTDPLYNQSHQFFVDGAPQSGDVQFSDASWHTLLVGGVNAGGKGVYALDVTDPASLTTEAAVSSAVKWEFTDPNMGFSYSEPQIARINSTTTTVSSFAVFFGNGYNSSSQNPWFFAINPQTGQKLTGIDLCAAVLATQPTACDATKPNGLSSVAVDAQAQVGSAISRVYAGDLQGNMWAIDVSNVNPSSWSVRRLYKALDSGSNTQAITTPPAVTLNPNYPSQPGDLVMFGTGQFLTATDLNNTTTQSTYGILDAGGATPYSRSDLQKQTMTLVLSATSGLPQDILTLTNNSVNYSTKFGWYFDLITPGQRVVTTPYLNSSLLTLTLNNPPVNACSASPSAFLLNVNYANGGAPNRPFTAFNNNGVVTTINTYAGVNIAGVEIGKGYASAPNIYFRPDGGTSANVNGRSLQNPSSISITTSWWQLP